MLGVQTMAHVGVWIKTGLYGDSTGVVWRTLGIVKEFRL